MIMHFNLIICVSLQWLSFIYGGKAGKYFVYKLYLDKIPDKKTEKFDLNY